MACCFPDGTCQDLDPVVCFNNNGHPGPLGSACNNFVCPTPGACCIQSPLGLICRLLTQPECMAAGGMFQGPGTSCLDPGIACPAQPVACCLPGGACMDLTPTQCHNQGGQSQGPGSACNNVVCGAPIGACCIANAGFIECRMVTQQQCSALNGAYQGNGTSCNSPNIMCPGTSIRVACCKRCS